MLTDQALISNIAIRVYLDLDPAFTQLWQGTQGIDMRLAGHTHFVTIGRAIGQPGCAVPTCGLAWLTTPQPVVLRQAKSGYVVAHCGWFSDRSICYLASGRPVIAQDTGFTSSLPAGRGLFAFSTIDHVPAAVDEINADYAAHARAARAIAEEYFEASMVLTRLLRQVDVLP